MEQKKIKKLLILLVSLLLVVNLHAQSHKKDTITPMFKYSTTYSGTLSFNSYAIPKYPDTSKCYFLEISTNNQSFKWNYGFVVLINGAIKNGAYSWYGEHTKQSIGPFDNTFLYTDKRKVQNKVLMVSIVETLN